MIFFPITQEVSPYGLNESRLIKTVFFGPPAKYILHTTFFSYSLIVTETNYKR